MVTETKIEKVRKHLLKHKTITQREAIRLYRYYRLSDGILKLRKRGMDISTQMVRPENGDSFGRYHYVPSVEEEPCSLN